ncbi:hypothetical protein SK128_006576, partial [Halocaridina rubra]
KMGFAGKKSRVSGDDGGTTIRAYPLYSLLLALNVTNIDYFSLDIEGQEMKVLETIPWDKVKFKVLSIEKILIPEGEAYLTQYMEERGYKFIGHGKNDAWFVAPAI